MSIRKVFLKTFGFSAEPLKQYHDRDLCFGANVQTDNKVKIGLVVYFYKTVFGLWWLR